MRVIATLCLALCATFVFAQGPGRLAPGTGIVTGTVQIEGGGSMAGVRVAVVASDDLIGANLVSLAETDAAGHYRLTDIPQGHYYIVAGRVSSLTYFPGGGDRTRATEITVEAARTVSNINFKVPADSRRPAPVENPGLFSGAEWDAYHASGREKNAFTRIKLLLAFERNFPKSAVLPQVYEDLVDLYTAKGDLKPAMEYGEKLLEKDPDNIWVLVKVSRVYGLSQIDLRQALQYGEKAVATVAKLKAVPPASRPPQFRSFKPVEWNSMIAALDESTKSNVAWVKQVMAWNTNALNALGRTLH